MILDVVFAPLEAIRGQPLSLSVTVRDGGGALVDPGPVTIDVRRWDGTLVTSGPMSGTGAAPRTLSLSPSHLPDVDLFTVTVSGASFGTTTQTIPVVGAPLFTLTEARAFDQGQLADPTRYPDELLVALRARIREAFVNITGKRFVPELVEAVVSGTGTSTLVVPDVDVLNVRAVWLRRGGSWQPLDPAQLASMMVLPYGTIVWTGGVWPDGPLSVRIVYEAGMERVPLEIRRAALKLACSYMGALSSNLPDRALSLSDELGTFRLATPGFGGSFFGLPEVDAVLKRYQVRVPGVA